ncbi:MAG TPA: hypothetical protein VNK04_01785 [Gemmataceae bacterium]|nr:hypothetical protein [Gemmataceae bacterium]
MAILISCRSCGRRLRVPEEMCGQLVQCPACELTFTAPLDGEASPEPSVNPLPPPRPHDADEDEEQRRRRPPPSYEDEEDYPIRRRQRGKPGKVQAIALMTLIGGIIGIKVGLAWVVGAGITSGGICCFWPGGYYSLVMGILAIIKGIQLLGPDDRWQAPPRTTAILQVINIINLDLVNCVMGILILVFLNENEVRRYYRG